MTERRATPIRRKAPRPTWPDELAAQVVHAGLPMPVKEHRFHPKRLWRFDLAWPDYQLAVEVQGGVWIGGRHVRGGGIEGDCEKASEAAILGWRLLPVTSGMVRSGQALDFIKRALIPDVIADVFGERATG